MTQQSQTLTEFLASKDLATATDDQLANELERRKLIRPFPLDVFHEKTKPFIQALHKEYDIPRSYVGLSMLSAYSSAIGTAYHIKLNKLGDIYFPIWACLEGISSAGKSLIMNQVFKPHYQIQEDIEKDWFTKIENKTDDAIQKMPSKQLIYAEAHIPTLIKDVMPCNPKGVMQDADEILSWINGMNQLSKGGKEGTDEQFWMKSWNCKSHRKRLSGNKIFVIKRPFLNVFGGAQPSIMWKLFKNDRDKTGFIFRLLFAVPETHKIAEPNLLFDMPEEWETLHYKCINSLYRGLPMDDDEDSRVMEIDPRGLRMYLEWAKERTYRVNRMDDILKKEIHSGILGKVKEYCLRFAGILHISDKAYDGLEFRERELISIHTMERAIKLAEYFYDSAADVSERVSDSVIASPEVIRMATYVKAGWSFQRIGDTEYPKIASSGARRMRATREIRRMIKEYPKVFGAEVKN
jgi:hypothetical protein